MSDTADFKWMHRFRVFSLPADRSRRTGRDPALPVVGQRPRARARRGHYNDPLRDSLAQGESPDRMSTTGPGPIRRLICMQSIGITPIVDLFHYGTPLWLEGGIMNPIFGEAQSWYVATFARRYPHITYYTPTNEPYIEATFGAEWAIWYPFLRGEKNAARSLVNVTSGLSRSMLEVRKVRPDALMMVADTCEYYHSVEGAFKEEADFRTLRRFLVHDMYQGLLNREHAMWEWLVRNGIEPWELEWFIENPVRLDILGLDYYRHSEHQLRKGPNGERIDETAQNQFGWAEMSRQYSERYGGIPVFLAETNVGGPVEDRVAWFKSLVDQTRVARGNGVPVAGLTYYGAIDHVDWDTALRVRNLNINPCGMWALSWQGDKLVRTPTALVDLYRQYISQPVEETVGPLTLRKPRIGSARCWLRPRAQPRSKHVETLKAQAYNLSMITTLPGPSPRDFLWAGGVEDTFVPHTRPGIGRSMNMNWLDIMSTGERT